MSVCGQASNAYQQTFAWEIRNVTEDAFGIIGTNRIM